MKMSQRVRPSKRATGKAATRGRIVSSASRLIRSRGFAGASVERVMRDAGLTTGGFYAHFRSKSALDAEVLAATLAGTRERWFAGLESRAGLDWLAPAVKRYLSAAHRDSPGDGCALPAVLSELTRGDKKTRQAMVEAIETAAQEFAAHSPAAGLDARRRALATLALCFGGLTLARALRGHPASDEMLAACVQWALPELHHHKTQGGSK